MTTPRDIANAQLAAYNARDLAAFMAPFADDAWLEDLPTGYLPRALQRHLKAALRRPFHDGSRRLRHRP